MKVVINKCYGGYGLSKEAYDYLGLKWRDGTLQGYAFDDDRTNTKLVRCIEELGDKAHGELAKLEIVEIPDGIDWEIEEYDGVEWVAEKHRTWG